MKEKTIQTAGTFIECPLCKYIWCYTGKFILYASCPSCRKNVRIQENKINEENLTIDESKLLRNAYSYNPNLKNIKPTIILEKLKGWNQFDNK